MTLVKATLKTNIQNLLSNSGGNTSNAFVDGLITHYTSYVNQGLFVHGSIVFSQSTVSNLLKSALNHTNPSPNIFSTALANGLTADLPLSVPVPLPNYVLVLLPPTGSAALISGINSDLSSSNSYDQAATKISNRLDTFSKTLSTTVNQISPPLSLPPEFLT